MFWKLCLIERERVSLVEVKKNGWLTLQNIRFDCIREQSLLSMQMLLRNAPR